MLWEEIHEYQSEIWGERKEGERVGELVVWSEIGPRKSILISFLDFDLELAVSKVVSLNRMELVILQNTSNIDLTQNLDVMI